MRYWTRTAAAAPRSRHGRSGRREALGIGANLHQYLSGVDAVVESPAHLVLYCRANQHRSPGADERI